MFDYEIIEALLKKQQSESEAIIRVMESKDSGNNKDKYIAIMIKKFEIDFNNTKEILNKYK